MKQPDEKLRALNSQPSAPGLREEVYCTKIGGAHPEAMYIVAAHMDGIGWGEAANDDGSGKALVMELARIFSSPDIHDMILFDHGMPKKDGTMSKEQRPEADVNIEYQVNAKLADASMALAHKFQLANDKYASDYPANVGPHMTNTDSTPFMDLTPSISLRENERGAQLGNAWDPQHHQPTDLYATCNDDDFRLDLNAAQTTLGAIAQLTGAKLIDVK